VTLLIAVASVAGQLALGALLGAFGTWARIQLRTRLPAARIWALDRSRPVHIVTAQDESDFAAEFTVKVYPAEYLAAVEVRSLLAGSLKAKEVDLYTSNNFPMGRLLSDNLVCIGGPVHNRATKMILERINPPLHFDGYSVVSDVSGKRYEALVAEESNVIKRDVGVIVLCRNPFHPPATICLLMGARTFGCPAGSRLLTHGSLKKIEDVLGTGTYRWAILDVDVVDDFVARVDILEAGGEVPEDARGL
jgi:hypothetical protein